MDKENQEHKLQNLFTKITEHWPVPIIYSQNREYLYMYICKAVNMYYVSVSYEELIKIHWVHQLSEKATAASRRPEDKHLSCW